MPPSRKTPAAALPPPQAEALWAALPLPAVVVDAADRIRAVNPAAEAYLNGSARALAGQPVWDRIHADAPIETALERIRAGHAELSLHEIAVGTGERAPQSANIHIAPLSESSGDILIVMEPRALGGRLRHRTGATQAAQSAVGMAQMLAHEIKNPLAGITGAAQLLSMGLGGEEREMTGLIVEETRRILSLLERVEEFGNLPPPQRRAVNVHDVLDRARRSAQLGFAAHLRLYEDYDPSLPPSWADPDQLLQAIQNLLKNAAEALGDGPGEITLRSFYDVSLRLRRADGQTAALPLQIEIVDNGPGIPAEIAADVFDPFVSGKENGTGLGLAVVARIVAAHEGWVSAESVPGRTAIRISLPVAPREKEDD
ncbi:MAG TPA: PAS domain-containing sensor histidine kinase [Rhodobacteraceae bacterium]|jgi:two-component system nitrogen regulation sensor histidine kinase GlnL|nr:PAS domain-containing protein [Paracoccaceae bacterium]HBG98319.1 PAS domain-containing sensor histidine kinase [Paracoccaceae bacterium]